ncbi:MAG: hypothetical protein KGO96_07555 [Elusimicrobia bacterium]|nr:hypothetical protein [Elusimicrobiota bacterium]
MSLETDQLQQQEQEILRKVFASVLNPGSVPVAENVPAVVVSTSEPQPEIQTVMQGVEQRLEQANCYKLLLNDSLFAGELSPIAAQVQEEIRQFITDRLETLLGIKAEKTQSVFSDEEITALKTVANTLLSKPKLLGSTTPKLPPTLNKQVPVKKPELRLKKTVFSEAPKVKFVETVEEESQYQEPESMQPVVQAPVKAPVQVKRKGGRPKKVITSPVAITRPDGTVVHPEINMEGQVKPGPAAAKPAPMPSMAAQNMMMAAQAGEMANSVASNPFMASAIGQSIVKASK